MIEKGIKYDKVKLTNISILYVLIVTGANLAWLSWLVIKMLNYINDNFQEQNATFLIMALFVFVSFFRFRMPKLTYENYTEY